MDNVDHKIINSISHYVHLQRSPHTLKRLVISTVQPSFEPMPSSGIVAYQVFGKKKERRRRDSGPNGNSFIQQVQ